jgi:serine/threonine protein kinase
MTGPNGNSFSLKVGEASFAGFRDGLIGGRYALERELGRGGVGEVMLAQDTQLERRVAVKRIRVEVGESGWRSQLAIDEAKRLARLQHPNIVTVHDVLDHKGDVLLVMEYLRGYTLDDLKAPMLLEEFVEVARQTLSGLGAAHALGMVHLDIKPTNIMLTWLATGQLQVKLLDFGLATMMDRPARQSLTKNGQILGSVHTMAPEQFEQEPVGIYTDLYSLGCVFYRALSRQDAFEGESMGEVIQAHLHRVLKPLGEWRPDLPAGICTWVDKLMARRPEDRPKDATSALASLFPMLPARGAAKATSVPDHPGENGAAEPPGGSPIDVDPRDQERLKEALGKKVLVEGVVDRIWENTTGTIRFLDLAGISHREFSLLVKAGEPEFSLETLTRLIGSRIQAAGTLSEFHGCPQIIIETPDQLRRCESGL